MSEKLVVQLIDETQGEEGEVIRRFRWGFVDELSEWLKASNQGTAEALLGALEGKAQPATLLLPGYRVISTSVPYNKKEARHFNKLLPYEVEEDVLCDVEALHFAVGSKESDVVTVAYVEKPWLEQLLAWFEQEGIGISACYADYQALNVVGDEYVLWFTDDYLWGHRSNGLGFSIAQHLSQPLLKDLLENQHDEKSPLYVRVYVPDNETQEIIDSHIMPDVHYEVVVGEPALTFEQANQLSFLSGRFGKKLPVERWWQEAKPLAILAAVVAVVFLAATFVDIYSFKRDSAKFHKETLAAFRSAVPQGRADDPVRLLKAKLGTQGQTSGEPSQSIFLLSKVAPILDTLKIELATLNYSQRDKALRINVKAKSFNGIEQLRQRLTQEGVQAELQTSQAVDDGFQARIRVTLGEV